MVDKLSPGPKEPRTGCRQHGPNSPQLVPTYVYPVQYGSPGYGNQPSGSLYPWEIYNGQIIEYHDLNFNSASTPCACQEFSGTLRGRPAGTKCKKCRKPRSDLHSSPTFNQQHSSSSSAYAKKLQLQEGVAPVPKKNLVYRDPYEFHGTFGRKQKPLKPVDDEWQAYWDQEEDEFVDAKAVVPFAPSGLASKIRPRSKSPEPFRHLRVRRPNSVSDLKIVERAVATQQANKNNGLAKNLSTFSQPKKLNNGHIKDDVLITELESETNNSVEKVDEKCFEVKESESCFEQTSSSPEQPTRKQGIIQGTNFEENTERRSELTEDSESVLEAKPIDESSPDDKKTDESDSSADKGLIDETTRRKLIEDAESLLVRSELRRPKKLRSSDYRLRRKYQQQRRKNSGSSSGSGSSSSSTSFLIDEVILEEDEEALEAENLEVISSRPSVPVKSILKRPSQTSPSCSSDDSDPESQKRDENEIETSDLETSSLASLVRRRKKGVTFNTESIVDMGNVASTASPTTSTTTTTSRRITLDQIERSQSSTPETEDELTGYSKVVVSQNLAEEILDEIYGKLTQVETGQSTNYENADFFSSAAPPFFLFQESAENDGNEPPRSLAEEILDELYGGDQTEFDDSAKRDGDDDENDFYEEIRDVSSQPAKNETEKPRNVNPVLAGK